MTPIKLTHLYAAELNIYGDTGNMLVLQKRLEWRGYTVVVKRIGIGQTIPADTEFIMGGGGQDAAQSDVEADIRLKQATLASMVEAGVPMLVICGTYQLFGRSFTTHEGKVIKGLGILPLETRAEEGRLIGNSIVLRHGIEIVGYENHSGRTYLDEGAEPFARVLKGKGNNDSGVDEGIEYQNVIGTYMHGPLLSKNPELADEIIALILRRRGVTGLAALDDTLEVTAHEIAKKRPR